MTPEQVLLAVQTISAVIAALAAVAAVIVGLAVRQGIAHVHVDLNSRLSELIEAEKAAAKAEGIATRQAEDRLTRAIALEERQAKRK